MNALPKIDLMKAATRLTREGRLKEAMAVLRAALPGAASTAAASEEATQHRQEPADGASSILDMMPPRPGTDGAWTSPQTDEAHRAQVPPVSGALRGFLDRLGAFGADRGLDGRSMPGANRAPAPLPDGARFEERTYANAAGSRNYKLYVPSGYRGQAVPLMVMLHGCTQSPDDFAAGTRMNELAEEQNFLVAYPAQPQSANASKCWNWFSAGDQQRGQGEPSLIAGITREIMGEFAVEPGRVYVAGLSAGGAAAAIMGATYPELYAAIGVHSGLACGAAKDMPTAFAAMRHGAPPTTSRPRSHARPNGAIPTIVFHGDRDRTVHRINGDQVIAQAKAAADLGITVRRGTAPGGIGYTCTIQADENGRPVLEHWVLHGVGHAWSGGSTAGSYTEPRGPHASGEMVRFFLQHNATTG